MLLGHCWSNADGVILGIDEPVASLLHYASRELEGLSYLAITHPADRLRSAAHVASLMPGVGPTGIRKRCLTSCGDEVWLSLEVTRIGGGPTAGHMIGSFMTERVRPDPEQRWLRARRILDLGRLREEVIGRGIFADHAWTLMLHLYLAEAEGRIASIARTATLADVSTDTMMRWRGALIARNLAESVCADADAIQLTRLGIETIEQLLDADEAG